MRGVTYAPTPVGNDPGWGYGSYADYHSTDYSDIVRRRHGPVGHHPLLYEAPPTSRPGCAPPRLSARERRGSARA